VSRSGVPARPAPIGRAAAAISGASLQIVHINSTCAKDSLECPSLVAGARAHGPKPGVVAGAVYALDCGRIL